MLAEAQVQSGQRVTVLVTNPGGQPAQEEIGGVRVLRVARLATVASTPLTVGFLPVIQRLKPDLTHLHFPYPVGEISQFISGRRPYVITYHSDVVRASQQAVLRLYRPLMTRILRSAARILPTSQNYIASSPYLQSLAGHCTVVPLGIDPAPFIAAGPKNRESGRPILLFVGRHRYYKGVDHLLRAMPSLDADLWIGGSGPQRAEWEALADSLSLRDPGQEKVRFLGDVPDADLPGLYGSADIFVLPANARAEAFGTVLLEAMAAGLPCVTTELGTGTSYVVQDGQTGLVVPPRDPQALAGALGRLLADPALRRQMGQAGRERVLAEFTLEIMARRIERVYRAVETADVI